MVRLFIAAPVPAEIRPHLRGALADFSGYIERAVPEENWHVTFLFLGEAATSAQILQQAPAQLPQLFVPAALVTHVGRGRAARQLWAHIEPTGIMHGIHQELRRLFHLEEDDRPFAPHIKLATLRREEAARFIADRAVQQGFRIDELSLLRSEQAATGPYYQAEKVIRLGL